MKTRIAILLAILLLNQEVFAQPPETNYEGTVIATGFKQDIPFPSSGPFDIGFNFTFFGNTYTQFYVNANGLVMFTAQDNLYDDEVTIPSASLPNNYIAPFWDNLSILDGGNIMYKTISIDAPRKCVIQFKNMGFDPITSPFGTFSVILYETTNVVQVQYRLIVDPYTAQSHGESATIGLENADGSAGTLYAFHQGNAVYSEDAISFTPSGTTTYTVNSDAVYDGVFLTTNLSLPDPGIVDLVSPSKDAVVGEDHTFIWTAAANATSYYLVLDTTPDLSTATYTPVGLNLSHTVNGLTLNQTYYWSVFAYNSTSTTWCEVSRFYTDPNPDCVPVPLTKYTEQGKNVTITLLSTNCDNPTAIITSLPAEGELFQYNAGVKGPQITAVPTNVTDANRNVIYYASGNTGNGVGNFNFKMNDPSGDSPEATITINVSSVPIPNVLNVAKSTTVEIELDQPMADPAGKQDQFTVKVNTTSVTISSAALKTGDPYTIVLTLATPLGGTETVSVAYTQGDVASAAGGLLLSFTDQPVTLTAQTITWTQSLDKKYNESPFALTATASSGLEMTYSSSNPAVATITGNIVTLKGLGTSDITARQAGNTTTFAPLKCIRPLTVSKGDQTITFNPLPEKTLGDPDFNLTATASSGLPVSFTSSDTDVAIVTGTLVQIIGQGTTTITASQAGSELWNPADTTQPLTVKGNQIITFNPLPEKTLGDPDFKLTATASSGLKVSYTSGNTSVAIITGLTGDTVHIVGAGTTNITASQAGSVLWNPAPDKIQPLTVNITPGVENPLATEANFNVYSRDNLIIIQTLEEEWDGKTGTVKLFDIAGKPVRILRNTEFSRNSQIEVPVASTSRLYVVEIRSGTMRVTRKVVVR